MPCMNICMHASTQAISLFTKKTPINTHSFSLHTPNKKKVKSK